MARVAPDMSIEMLAATEGSAAMWTGPRRARSAARDDFLRHDNCNKLAVGLQGERGAMHNFSFIRLLENEHAIVSP